MISFTSLQISDIQTDDMFELDRSILKYINSCYYYNELFNTDEYSLESFGDKVKQFSKDAIQFIIKLLNKCIAALSSLWTLLSDVAKKAVKALVEFITKNAAKEANAKAAVLSDWFNELDRYRNMYLRNYGFLFSKSDFRNSYPKTGYDEESPNYKKHLKDNSWWTTEESKKHDKNAAISDIKSNLKEITKHYCDKYEHATSENRKFDSSELTEKIARNLVDISHAIENLKRLKNIYVKFLQSKSLKETRAKTKNLQNLANNEHKYNFGNDPDWKKRQKIEDKKQEVSDRLDKTYQRINTINDKAQNVNTDDKAHIGKTGNGDTYVSRFKELNNMLKHMLDYATAMQNAISVWIKYCKNTLALINKARGGSGSKGVLLSFNVPQDVKKELGEYFGKYHDQGKTLPLKVNKVIVVDAMHENAAASDKGISYIVCLSVTLFLKKNIEDMASTLLHELVHISQHNRKYIKKDGTKTNRYYLKNPIGYAIGLTHDEEFVEKQADKVSAQFIHDVKSGKIPETCATYKWIKDMKQQVLDYIKKHDIKIKNEVSLLNRTYIHHYLKHRREKNRKEDLPLQEKRK